MEKMSRIALLALGAALVSGCDRFAGPKVENPLNGQYRYTCCNIRYEKPEISDVNYTQGTLVPYGTRVQILEVKKNSVRFQPDGHPEMTLVYRHGRKIYPFETYLDRMFLVDDPRMATAAPVGKKKGASRGGSRFAKQMENGLVEPGMTKDEVLKTLGYPPAHRTASLESPVWTYWRNRWETYVVYFDGDKVDRISR
jgi:hypothetical protein